METNNKRIIWHLGHIETGEGIIEQCNFIKDNTPVFVFLYYDECDNDPPGYNEDTVAVFKVKERMRYWD